MRKIVYIICFVLFVCNSICSDDQVEILDGNMTKVVIVLGDKKTEIKDGKNVTIFEPKTVVVNKKTEYMRVTENTK
ncbi:MAG: hypothetical protein JXR90_04155 [Spirochaetes bacterium]|nr:hypothetical protein [Spirochaetota bacterium]